jgi:D-glycero-D-manno-heptose 1,7-bisphosphate phosphatase
MTMAPAPIRPVMLDRDGVINYDSPDYVKSPAEWRPLPGSLEAIAALTRAGFAVFVVTNQSGVARGLFGPATLEAIHAKMTGAVWSAGGALAGIYHCPHAPDAGCDCRKPAAGLLRKLAADHGVALAGAPLIGDKVSDLEAAAAVAARPILVRSGQGERAVATARVRGWEVFDDLAAAAATLVAEGREG